MFGSMALKNSISRKRLKFSGFEFIFWTCFAVGPYLVVYMREQGFRSDRIGLILAINAVIGIVTQPLWGLLADWLKSFKKVFMLCMGVCSITYASLFFLHSQPLIIMVLCIDAFFRCALISLTEAWMVSSLSGDNSISYGSIRLCGSISWAAMVLVYGFVIEGRAVGIIFLAYFVLVAATMVAATKIKDIHPTSHSGIYSIKPSRLLKNGRYMTFMIFIFLLNIPNNAAQTFIPNLFSQVGGNMEQYGTMHSVKALLEVPFFLFGTYFLNRFGAKKLILTASVIYLAQQLAFAYATTPLQVMLAQLLLGPSYSMYLLAMLNYIFALTPAELKGTALTMAYAFGGGLSAIVGNYGGGLFIEYFSLKPMYIVGSISDAVIIVLFVLSLFYYRRRDVAHGIPETAGLAD